MLANTINSTSGPVSSRVEKARERLLGTKPFVDLENAQIMTESFLSSEGEAYVFRKAKAFREQCERKTVRIWEDELIVGQPGSKIRYGLLCPDACWSILESELDTISTRSQDPFEITEEDKQMFLKVIKPYWQGKSVYETWQVRLPEDIRQLSGSSAIYVNRKAVRGPGELTGGYDWIVQSGINGIRKTIDETLSTLDPTVAEEYDKIQYLKALLEVCDGIVTLSNRYAQLAENLAKSETDTRRKEELNKIAQICRWVPENPARTFWEGLQAVWLYHACILMDQNATSYNIGRVDQYLNPLYQSDIDGGNINQAFAQELLDSFWVKFSEPCLFQDKENAKVAAGYMMFQNACCGGVDENGQNAVNNLSYMVLQATMDVRLYQPSLSVRYNLGKNPDSFLRKVVELISLGTGFPAFHNDEVGIKMMMDKGVSLKEAHEWNPCGCVETNLMGKMKGITDFAEVNLGSAVEFALIEGRQRLTGTQLLPSQGHPSEFENFTAFKEAVKKSLSYMIKKIVEANQVLESITWRLKPVPVASLSHKECVKRAKDYEWGGAKYNTGNGIILIGVADLLNSLAAINKIMYEDKSLKWGELLEALSRDFEGYEDIRNLCMSAAKWGNDLREVDDLATEMFQFIADEVRQYNGRHGQMTCGILPVTAEVPLGAVVGALPSGRKAWKPLTDGISPTGGTDITGPTAVLKSISRIPHHLFTSGTLLNMKLDPVLIEDDRGKSNLMDYLKSFCDLGNYHIQFNVVTTETLQKAQKIPEDYRDLLVRVSGYTAYFVELGKEIQDEIIGRTTQSAIPK